MGNLDFSANADQLKELAAYMASQINVPTIGIGGGYAPIGAIVPLMGTTAPQDYLACDGTVYNIADYPQLADYFESQFGESNHFGGNGTTTFAVPDLRGEFLRCTGTNSHANQGSGGNVGEHQDGTRVPMTTASNDYGAVNVFTDTNNRIGADFDNKNITGSKIISAAATSINTSTSLGAYTSRPTNTSVLYCIKAVVAGEVYSTEERVVGTWIDGKPLYQKTINFGTLPNNTTKNVAHGISNLKRVMHISGTWIQSGYSGSLETIGSDSNIDVFVDATNLSITVSSNLSNRSVYVTLQYTKTTD